MPPKKRGARATKVAAKVPKKIKKEPEPVEEEPETINEEPEAAEEVSIITKLREADKKDHTTRKYVPDKQLWNANQLMVLFCSVFQLFSLVFS